MSPALYHPVGYVPQSARQPLGVVAHGPPPHVFRQGSKHMATACGLVDSFQHGAYLRCPSSGKRYACTGLKIEMRGVGLFSGN